MDDPVYGSGDQDVARLDQHLLWVDGVCAFESVQIPMFLQVGVDGVQVDALGVVERRVSV